MPYAFACASIWVEVRRMDTKRPRVAGLSLALVLLALVVASAQAGAAKPQPNKVKQTPKPIWTLSIDGPRVAYASGGRIYGWNVATGATSVVKGAYSNAKETDNAAEIAIAGKRVAWIKRQELGNTEQPQRLYTAPVGGSAHRLRRVLGYRDLACGPGGSQIAGLVGSGSSLAVSTWQWSTGGSVPVPTHQRLNLITPTGLRAIATNPGAIVSASADGGHIAVVALPTPTWNPEAYCDWTSPTSVAVYSVNGTLLQQIETGGPVAEVALGGNLLVVLRGTSTPTFAVYDWKSGTLLHSWPVARSPFDVAVAGQLAVYSVNTGRHLANLHLLNLATGKDVVVATTRNILYRSLALDQRGLVYAVNHWDHSPFSGPSSGKLVFVPTAKLLAALNQ
jgi:hypothetical protein